MSALLCPNCGKDLAEWLAHRREYLVINGTFVEMPPDGSHGAGLCPDCRAAFVSDKRTFVRSLTENDIRRLDPISRMALADAMRGADLTDQKAFLSRHAPVAS